MSGVSKPTSEARGPARGARTASQRVRRAGASSVSAGTGSFLIFLIQQYAPSDKQKVLLYIAPTVSLWINAVILWFIGLLREYKDGQAVKRAEETMKDPNLDPKLKEELRQSIDEYRARKVHDLAKKIQGV